jgi:hypothetical protein
MQSHLLPRIAKRHKKLFLFGFEALTLRWKQDNQGMDFELFYKHKTEKIIEHLKSQIQDEP